MKSLEGHSLFDDFKHVMTLKTCDDFKTYDDKKHCTGTDTCTLIGYELVVGELTVEEFNTSND